MQEKKWKKSALATALTCVFGIGITGTALAAIDPIDIGGIQFEYLSYLNSYGVTQWQTQQPKATWDFSSSSAFSNGSYRDIDFNGAQWKSIASGYGARGSFNHDTRQVLKIKGDNIFDSLSTNDAYLDIRNQGTLAIEGVGSAAIYSVAAGARANVENTGVFTVNGGSGGGIRFFYNGYAASGRVNNQRNATMSFTGGEGVMNGLDYFASNAGSNSLENSGTLKFTGGTGYSSHGVDTFTVGCSTTFTNNVGGVVNVVGGTQVGNGIRYFTASGGNLSINNHGVFNFTGLDYGGYAVNTAAYGGKATLTNYAGGVININNKGIDQTKSLNGTFILNNRGTINAEAETFFERFENDVVVETPLDIVIYTPSQGKTKTVNLDSYVASETQHIIDWTMKGKWADSLVFEPGGTLTITNIASGSKDAERIQKMFESVYGTGTRLNFTGTQSYRSEASSHNLKPNFSMSHVNELISKGELQNGAIITSETLTHNGHQFIVGNYGDLKQDAGFQGILGATSITVKDGKSLTLMGAQASLAKATGTDDRSSLFVISDSTTNLYGGSLNLGHTSLSATEGRLASVTMDRASQVNVNNGIFSVASLNGDGQLNVNDKGRLTIENSFTTSNTINKGTLTVNGKTTITGKSGRDASTYAVQPTGFVNEKGTTNFNGGLHIGRLGTLTNKTDGTINAGNVTLDGLATLNAYRGSKLNFASLTQNGTLRVAGMLTVTGVMTIDDAGTAMLGGEAQIGTLSVGRTAHSGLALLGAAPQAIVENTGKTYVDELDLVSGTVNVRKDSVLAGVTLKDGAVGSDIKVDAGGTFAFSYNKSGLEEALKNYKGDQKDKAILALSTDLHFGNGGSLTVGTVEAEKGTVNLGHDALLLVGTTQLHGNALMNGESAQQLHAEKGATIAMSDDLIWGNHYIFTGFDEDSSKDIMNVGVKDKDGKDMTLNRNDRGIFVTIGSDNILDKDKDYRLISQMNWMLDGHQDLTSKQGDVAFMTNALISKTGAQATNRMEALGFNAGILSETQRLGSEVLTTMLDHASSARKGSGTFWTEGLISKTDSGAFKRSTEASGYESDTTGFAFGVDLPLGDDSWRLGSAFSVQRGDLDGEDGLSSNIEGYGLSVYGGKTFTSGLNLTGAMTYLTSTHEVSENNLGAVKADVDANLWTLGARLSMPFGYQKVWMTPYVGADVMKLSQDGFTASWSGKSAFNYSDVDATIFRTPVGVKAGTFFPLELFGRSGTMNWDMDFAFVRQFGDKNAQYRVSGASSGLADDVSGDFANDWLTTANIGMSWQGAAGAFGVYYGMEKGDVRDWSSSVKAKASLFF